MILPAGIVIKCLLFSAQSSVAVAAADGVYAAIAPKKASVCGLAITGLVPNTKAPDPVSSVTAAARLVEDGVQSHVATPEPNEVMPVPPCATVTVALSVRITADALGNVNVFSDVVGPENLVNPLPVPP